MPDPEIADLLSKLGTTGQQPPLTKMTEVGTDAVGPTLTDKTNTGLVTLPFDEEFMNLIWLQVEKAESRRKFRETSWDLLLNEYMPVVSPSGEPETVKVQAHFRNTHSKLGSLFFKTPDLVMVPDDPGPANNSMPDPRSGLPQFAGQTLPPLKMEDVIAIKAAVLKKKLGRDGIKAERLMDEMLFDVLQWSGLGVCKVGYACTMKSLPKMGPPPTPAAPPPVPGSVLGLTAPPSAPVGPPVPQMGPDGQPLMEDVPIFEDWYARRFSPKKFLCDPFLRSTRFEEDASWMGMDFFLTPKVASQKYGIPEDQLNKAAEDDRVHQWSWDAGAKPVGMVHCIELWMKSSVWTPESNPHPQAMNQLVLVKGLRAKPVVWRASPDQDFDKNTGRITNDSLVGFPIKVLTIRDLADACFPSSDSAFTNSDIKQMSTWRRQSISTRDAALGKYFYDSSAFGDDEVEQLKNGPIGDHIAVADGRLKDGADKIYAASAKVTSSRDDYQGFAGIKQDMNETLGIGSNQAGSETDTVRTATEADKVASASQARNDKELGRVIDIYLDIARGVDQLLMRYMTDIEYVQIGGDAAGAQMQAWNGKLVSGKYLYEIAADSQLRPDNARDFQMDMQFYNLTAKDPMMNRGYLLKQMARRRGYDPAKLVMPPPPPPPPKPEPLKLSLNITADDLSRPEVLAFLKVYGEPVAPSLNVKGEQPQPPHGGPADQAEPISQHMMSNSGGSQNAPGASNHREGQVK